MKGKTQKTISKVREKRKYGKVSKGKKRGSGITINEKTSLDRISESVKQLERDFLTANEKQRLKIKRSLVLASNRADKKSKARNMAKKGSATWVENERKKKKYRDIAKIYRNAYMRMEVEEIERKIDL